MEMVLCRTTLFPVLFRWSYLEVVTNGKYDDTLQAYAAGVVEGAVTSKVF